MSDSNQTNSSAPAATGGKANRRPNPFGSGKNNQNYRERQERPPKNLPKNAPVKAPVLKPEEEPDPRDNGDNTCVVCFKVVDIYSIGECDHPVCYECSTRMRVLCQQNECPICRANLSKVIFTNDVLSYRQLEINNRTGLYDKKYRICFSSIACQEAYNKLLENPCSMCTQGPFANFAALREHVKKKHEQFYCDICTDNLSVFSFERRSYTRSDLGLHRRKGDPDDKSHRGHPLCEYCDLRYFDRDELFKHLRREHFYCHFCDADGANCYYADYAALRVHFKGEHYLCEEGECAQEQFTAVFRTEIDLRAHIANTHGQGLSRQAAKQNRTLEFEITLAPRTRLGVVETSGSRSRQRDTQNEFDVPEMVTTTMAPQRVIDARDEQQFPSLGGASATPSFSLRNVAMHKSYGTGGIARTKENFPALGGATAATAVPSTSGTYRQASASAMLKNTGTKASAVTSSNRPNTAKKAEPKSSQDFPSLSGGPSAKGKKGATLFLDDDFVPLPPSAAGNNIASKYRSLASGYEAFAADATAKLGMIKRAEAVQPKKPAEAPPKLGSKNNFPSLGNAPSPAMAAQWVSLGKKAPVESRKSKVAPPPLSTASPSVPAKAATKTSPPPAVASKKETKPKPVVKPTPTPAAPAKSQKKPKNFNPFEDDFEEEAFAPPTTVIHGLSAKHRGLVDSYESVSKTGATGGGKLSMVTRPSSDPVSNNAKTSAAPKLNSIDNFPSLSGKVSASNQAGVGINFLEIMKASSGTKTSPGNNNNNEMGNLNSVPPGFGGVKPPPGFKSVAVNSVAKSTNNLTFTTSLGDQYDILPASPTVYYPYVPPNNSSQRNLALFAHFQIIADQEVVESFKQVSQMFMNGAYKAEPYYEHCQIVLSDRFDAIFPELLVLLPDINKQQELYQWHIQQQTKVKLSNGGGAIPKNKKNNNNATSFEVCATCRQVLTMQDLPTHLQSHTLANHFPSLSIAKSAASSAWKNERKASGAPSNSQSVAKHKRSKVSSPMTVVNTATSTKAATVAIASTQQEMDKCVEQQISAHFQFILGGLMLLFWLIWLLC